MQKLLILQTFHRYAPTGEFRTLTRPGGAHVCVERERKEVFSQGSMVEVPGDLAADWIAKGLAQATEPVSNGDASTLG